MNVVSNYEEIRNFAANFKEFDAVLIAQTIAANKINSLATNNAINLPDDTNWSDENNMLALLNEESTTLTNTKKQELVKIKCVELGIDLVDADIVKIADMVAIQVNDTVEFLNEVTTLIQEYFINRNNQTKSIIDEKINNITTIINTSNEHLGDIFNNANDRINSIVGECSKVKTDYKSTYKTKLESIREILKLPA